MEKKVKKKCTKNWLLIGSTGNFSKVKGNATGKKGQIKNGEEGVLEDINHFAGVIKSNKDKAKVTNQYLISLLSPHNLSIAFFKV